MTRRHFRSRRFEKISADTRSRHRGCGYRRRLDDCCVLHRCCYRPRNALGMRGNTTASCGSWPTRELAGSTRCFMQNARLCARLGFVTWSSRLAAGALGRDHVAESRLEDWQRPRGRFGPSCRVRSPRNSRHCDHHARAYRGRLLGVGGRQQVGPARAAHHRCARSNRSWPSRQKGSPDPSSNRAEPAVRGRSACPPLKPAPTSGWPRPSPDTRAPGSCDLRDCRQVRSRWSARSGARTYDLEGFCPPRTMTSGSQPRRRPGGVAGPHRTLTPHRGPEDLVFAPADRLSGPPERERQREYPWRSRQSRTTSLGNGLIPAGYGPDLPVRLSLSTRG